MELFLSYASDDSDFAQLLAERLRSLHVNVFMLPGSVGGGADWLSEIRIAADRCDRLLTIISPFTAKRPWLAAEWAIFWFQGKTCTPILIGAEPSDLWEPMRVGQAVNASDTEAMESLLAALVGDDGAAEEPRVIKAARRLSEHPAVAMGGAEQALKRTRERLRGERFNIRSEDITALVAAGRVDELIAAATTADVRAVKQKQVAADLLRLGLFTEALEVTQAMGNRAEVKNVCLTALDQLSLGAPRSAVRDFIAACWSQMDAERRQIVVGAMRSTGLKPPAPNVARKSR